MDAVPGDREIAEKLLRRIDVERGNPRALRHLVGQKNLLAETRSAAADRLRELRRLARKRRGRERQARVEPRPAGRAVTVPQSE